MLEIWRKYKGNNKCAPLGGAYMQGWKEIKDLKWLWGKEIMILYDLTSKIESWNQCRCEIRIKYVVQG